MGEQKDQDQSLEDVLRELLSSTPEPQEPQEASSPNELSTASDLQEAALAEEPAVAEAPVGEVVEQGTAVGLGEAAEAESPQGPAAQMDLGLLQAGLGPMAPEASAVEVQGEPEPPLTPQPEAAPEAKAAIDQTPIAGRVEVRVVPPIIPLKVSQLERELGERRDLLWQGTWGNPKGGTVLHLQLDRALPLRQLFPNRDLVEKVEIEKAGKVWHLALTLREATTTSVEKEAAEASASQEPEQPPKWEGPETKAAMGAAEPEGMAGRPGRSIDLEVSPIQSLSDLSRFEKLMSSLGARTTNVLSLDGVSTVLFTLEGVSLPSLVDLLKQKVPDLDLEVGTDRVKARLPSSW